MSISQGCAPVLSEHRPTKPGAACSTQAGRTTKTEERWRSISGYPSYEVSDLGRVRRALPGPGTYIGKQLAQLLLGRPWAKYPHVHLCADAKARWVSVHTLVARAFLGEPPAGHEVDHVNRDKRDARLTNLEYVTRTENRRRRGPNRPASEVRS